ncbi:undecaprenyl/decaprenyl-phosphate alpha-N-acetylglucosaminyl 1-phosphate transferase, partial [Streptomyces sp. SID8455]|nr:undecaprenyl/decaprenyl-phosphate alpha-N-acetylglucosaminyl 1-phosphate transferase [Streptomyces sp. SID8455]
MWIVLVTSAFALLDTADGVLATVAAVTAAGLLACAAVDGRSGLALLPAVLLAGLI